MADTEVVEEDDEDVGPPGGGDEGKGKGGEELAAIHGSLTLFTMASTWIAAQSRMENGLLDSSNARARLVPPSYDRFGSAFPDQFYTG